MDVVAVFRVSQSVSQPQSLDLSVVLEAFNRNAMITTAPCVV